LKIFFVLSSFVLSLLF
jgi:hypothetical protein